MQCLGVACARFRVRCWMTVEQYQGKGFFFSPDKVK